MCTGSGFRSLVGSLAALAIWTCLAPAVAAGAASTPAAGCDLTVFTNCFTTHGPGCNEPCIEASVCAVDPFCCSVSWDSICVGEAGTIGVPCDADGDGVPDVCSGTPPCDLSLFTDCFMTHGPGCNEPCIEASVCAVDPFCCSVSWDSICVGEAGTIGVPCDLDGDGVADVCTGPPPPCSVTTATDCFTTHAAGCNEPCIEASVCAVDPFCCSVSWDSICVSEAGSIGVPCDTDGDGIPDVCECATTSAASETVRLGTPPNPAAFLIGTTGPPMNGGVWSPVISHATFLPAAIIDFIGIDPTPTNIPSVFGTLLCGLNPVLVVTGPPGVPFTLPIGPDCGFVGVSLCTQGGSFGPSIGLANAIDIVIGG
jgi:hypothetical protein